MKKDSEENALANQLVCKEEGQEDSRENESRQESTAMF